MIQASLFTESKQQVNILEVTCTLQIAASNMSRLDDIQVDLMAIYRYIYTYKDSFIDSLIDM